MRTAGFGTRDNSNSFSAPHFEPLEQRELFSATLAEPPPVLSEPAVAAIMVEPLASSPADEGRVAARQGAVALLQAGPRQYSGSGYKNSIKIAIPGTRNQLIYGFGFSFTLTITVTGDGSLRDPYHAWLNLQGTANASLYRGPRGVPPTFQFPYGAAIPLTVHLHKIQCNWTAAGPVAAMFNGAIGATEGSVTGVLSLRFLGTTFSFAKMVLPKMR